MNCILFMREPTIINETDACSSKIGNSNPDFQVACTGAGPFQIRCLSQIPIQSKIIDIHLSEIVHFSDG